MASNLKELCLGCSVKALEILCSSRDMRKLISYQSSECPAIEIGFYYLVSVIKCATGGKSNLWLSSVCWFFNSDFSSASHQLWDLRERISFSLSSTTFYNIQSRRGACLFLRIVTEVELCWLHWRRLLVFHRSFQAFWNKLCIYIFQTDIIYINFPPIII